MSVALTKEHPSEGDLRIWWIPQVPGSPFTVDVADYDEAEKLLEILAAYDTFQFEEGVKPDFANAGGLESYVGGIWGECDAEEWEARGIV